MVYQPMLELLAHLRANGFKTFIVSGGGVDFMRVFAERVYGIPPEQVVGSTGKVKFKMRGGKPVLVKLPEIQFVDDNVGKLVGIHQFIGRRPIAAFGNSVGGLQMLQWTTAGSGSRLGLLVHHTDSEREWAYDRTSHIGRLDKALDEAEERGLDGGEHEARLEDDLPSSALTHGGRLPGVDATRRCRSNGQGRDRWMGSRMPRRMRPSRRPSQPTAETEMIL